jgi:hypothetical protein
MTRQLTCSSPGKVEGDDGCVLLIPKEVNERRYLSFYKEGEIHTFRRQSDTTT